jgi:hypothetical protein
LPEPDDGRVIYVFAESKATTSFKDPSEIGWGDPQWNVTMPARVVSQHAGCLVGSTYDGQNLYGNLVIARLRLIGGGCGTTRTVRSVFPPASEDLLLRTLRDARPEPEGLY